MMRRSGSIADKLEQNRRLYGFNDALYALSFNPTDPYCGIAEFGIKA